ncbi:MAG: YHS domain-containing protein [Pseudomonadota bacterium]
MRDRTASERAIEQVAVDPVCGMNVPSHRKELAVSYKDATYYFCAEACRTAFVKNPERFLEANVLKRKGWWRRYLERMTRINKEQFGSGGPTCCN